MSRVASEQAWITAGTMDAPGWPLAARWPSSISSALAAAQFAKMAAPLWALELANQMELSPPPNKAVAAARISRAFLVA
ncbi:hypothetical protein AU476_20150 [Cupriavidus sp. UYMSc13B]|nr:hypothetical protein AU476_20150 [Cupriavidus sp. UYMSc13B]